MNQNKLITFLAEVFLDLQYTDNIVVRTVFRSQIIVKSIREYLGLIVVSRSLNI
tara:strand:+ start:8157 stop:8318 length:162 start_codon:yes stop_codon:yes gene_type:complete